MNDMYDTYFYQVFIREDVSDAQLEEAISKEFGIDINIAKKRIMEIKHLAVEFSSWDEIDLVKEMVFAYVSNHLVTSIAAACMVSEMLMNSQLQSLKQLHRDGKIQNTMSINTKKIDKLLMAGEKIQYLKELPLNIKPKEIVEKMSQLNILRKKYIHIKYLHENSDKKDLEKDALQSMQLIRDILFYIKPGSDKGIIGVDTKNPNHVLKLF